MFPAEETSSTKTRLSQARFPARREAVYRRAIDALQRAPVPFLLGGAIALHAHTGIWRDTKDLDVFCRPDDVEAVLAALRADGFATEMVYESWLAKGWSGEVFVDVIWRNANGLFPVDASWFEREATTRLFDRDVRVLPPEESIVSKIMVAGRHRFDGADVMHLLFATAHRLDWRRLEELVGEHAELLLAHLHMFRWGYPAWRDKVPAEVLDRFEARGRREPSSYGDFRARLLDLDAFDVDVTGWGMPDPHRQALEDIFGDAGGRT